MRNYGTIPTSSSEGTNELISDATHAKVRIYYARPWQEMVRSLDLVSGLDNTTQRMKTNLVYFRTNYMIILLSIMFLSFVFHPVSLRVFLGLLASVYFVFYFRTLMILSSMFNVILVLITDQDDAWINITSTLLIEAVIVAAHAYVRNTDDLSPDEEMPVATGLSNARPWKELLRSLTLPAGFHNTIERIKTNLVHFKINYVIISMLILCLSFLFHPVSPTVTLVLLVDSWLLFNYFHRQALTSYHRISLRIMIILVIIIMILLSFTEAAWINITSTLLIEAVLVAAHASFRNTDDLFVDEELAYTAAAGVLTSSSS